MSHQHSLHTVGALSTMRGERSSRITILVGVLSWVLTLAVLASVWAYPVAASHGRYTATIHLRTTPLQEGSYRGYGLHISFKAPAAVTNARTAYGLKLYLPKLSACSYGGSSGKAIEGDVRRGQVIHVFERLFLYSGCYGEVHGEVIYGPQPDAITGPDTALGGHVVGRFSFTASNVGVGSLPASHLLPRAR